MATTVASSAGAVLCQRVSADLTSRGREYSFGDPAAARQGVEPIANALELEYRGQSARLSGNRTEDALGILGDKSTDRRLAV
jgi:hypothetical protein